MQYYEANGYWSAYYNMNAGTTLFELSFYVLGEGTTPDPEPECEHLLGDWVGAVAATCTEAGYTGDVVCGDCGEIVEAGTAIAALGHDYVEGVCTRCGELAPVLPPVGGLTEVELSEIQPSDQVMIVMSTSVTAENYVLLNNGGASTYGPAAVFDGETYDATMLWNFVAVEGGYTIYVDGSTTDYLYLTASNNGMRVGTFSSGNVWNLDETGNYLCAADSNEAIRYMGVYDNNGGKELQAPAVPNFRSYLNTTGNTKDQAVHFFVVSD
jgi:hypothetical protein